MAITLNPDRASPALTFSEDLLTTTHATGDSLDEMVLATTSASTGKFYFEALIVTNADWFAVGLVPFSSVPESGDYPGDRFGSYGVEVDSPSSPGIYLYGDNDLFDQSDTYTVPEEGGTVALAVDFDAGKIWFRTNGEAWFYGGDPETGTSPTFTFVPGTRLAPAVSVAGVGDSLTVNFGDTAYVGTVPDGYGSWVEFVPGPGLQQDYQQTLGGVEYMIWTHTPNWDGGVVERLEWKTDVLTKVYQSEQRSGLRLSPSKILGFTTTLYTDSRRLIENQIYAWGTRPWVMPLWYDGQHLLSAVEVGQTTIPLDDNTWYRDFSETGYAILIRSSTEFEVLTLTGVSESAINCTGTVGYWPPGTRIYPVKFARIEADVKPDKIHSDLSEAKIEARIIETNDYPACDADDELPEEFWYGDRPLLVERPNAAGSLGYGFGRHITVLDNVSGLDYVEDLSDITTVTQQHQWLLESKYKQYLFRRLAYFMRGKKRSIAVPSFLQDVRLTTAADAGDDTISIQNQGYARLIAQKYNRNRLTIFWPGEVPQVLEIVASTEVSAQIETLEFDNVLDFDLDPENPPLMCFTMLARSTADTVDFLHHYESMAEVRLLFCSIPESGVPYFPGELG